MIPKPLGRLAYKLAYVGVRVVSLLAHPQTRGVKCLVCIDDDLLLVRHSYGPKLWELPGGFARRGEAPVATAARELEEELSVTGSLTDLGELRRRHSGRRELLGVVRADLPSRVFAIRGCELVLARWFPRTALPEERAGVIDEILAFERGLPPSGQG
ncbi:MAG: NUDIX hydrolase [Solirubrobacteraceae bacterium]